MSTFLIVVTAVAAAVAVVAALLYPLVCHTLEADLVIKRPKCNVDKPIFKAWNMSLDDMEQTRLFMEMVSLTASAITCVGTLLLVIHYDFFKGNASSLFALIFASFVCVFTIGRRTLVHNHRVLEIENDWSNDSKGQ